MRLPWVSRKRYDEVVRALARMADPYVEAIGREDTLRDIVIDWIEEGFTTPPYKPEVYGVVEWLGITNADIRSYNVERPCEADATTQSQRYPG